MSQERGYAIIPLQQRRGPGQEVAYLRLMTGRRMTVSSSWPSGVHPHLDRIALTGFPLVFLDRVVEACHVGGRP